MSNTLKIASAALMLAFVGTAFATNASAKTSKTCVSSTTKSQRVHCGSRKRVRLHGPGIVPVNKPLAYTNFRARKNSEYDTKPTNGDFGFGGRGGNMTGGQP
jgi:hypothetical protein